MGHSSSATLALLMASKEKRIAKCIALAPITDLNARLGDLLTDRSMSKAFPGLKEYLISGSPLTHVAELKCPVFLAHAKDDDNEPFQYSQAYVKALQAAGGNIVFDARSSGGHYQGLIDASVPRLSRGSTKLDDRYRDSSVALQHTPQSIADRLRA